MNLPTYPIVKTSRTQFLLRIVILTCILLAFTRVSFRLDAKNLWWDESLSLQRAESSFLPLVRGDLLLTDGANTVRSIDQHPFFSFLIQGLFVRLTGNGEFSLRFPSAMASTLLVAVVWCIGRFLAKKQVIPEATFTFAALLAAVNPFFLWYGQEARPYAAWAMLTILSTYLLMRIISSKEHRQRIFLGYLVILAVMLSTHYLAIYVVPIHALLLLQMVTKSSNRFAFIAVSSVLAIGLFSGLVAVWSVLGRYGSINTGVGANFPDAVGLKILIPDLINAFSFGLSVDINNVWWLDLLCAALVLLGTLWGMRSFRSVLAGGWILPLIILVPIVAIQTISNFYRVPYMNARHISLIGAPFILLLASGIGLVWRYQKLVAMVCLILILSGVSYSSYNYYWDVLYDKEHYSEMGNFLHERLLTGDILLLTPPHAARVYEYYLPVEEIDSAQKEGAVVTEQKLPLFVQPKEETAQLLEQDLRNYKRIWLAVSGTPSEADPEEFTKAWLDAHAFQLYEKRFHAYSSILDLYQYLPTAPFLTAEQAANLKLENQTDISFGRELRLMGYELERPLYENMARPVTFYWKLLEQNHVNYKYILQLVQRSPSGETTILTTNETAPFEAAFPTSAWIDNAIVRENSYLSPVATPSLPNVTYELWLQIYREDTLEKMPIEGMHSGQQIDNTTVAFPYPVPTPFVNDKVP
ncbi:MAG: glycosyltransferase family 39 protein [Caldilineaceae bacterium]